MQNSKGLTQIKINKDGQETTIEDPDEMEKLIIQWNIDHFSQAEKTPFALKILQ